MKQQSGFTLIELSVVIAIVGVLLYGSMSILITSVQTTQVNQTVAAMDAIEKALLDYRVAFNRLPCPTDLTATITNANYAVEAANMGSCTGGSPAANFIAASGTAEGGVPTRALGLPDSFMYDGWGHRFRYAVNPTYTVASVSSPTNTAAITVNDASGAARSTGAIYAIISHGANGHGGYTSNGVVVNAKSTNADEQTNCHCDNTAAHTGGAGVLSPVTYVQKAPTITTAGSLLTAFDDIVTYKEGWQMMTPNLATNDFVPVSNYYRTITIDHTKVGTVGNTDQTNFPVLFSGTYSYLATVANGGLVTNTSGYDITFTSDSAGRNPLPFERESYNATTGAVTFWVQVPNVSHTTNTVIYLQYDNSAITSDQSNKNAVWDSNFNGVWHLAESGNGTAGEYKDSTSNANNGQGGNGTASQVPTRVTGKFGYAEQFVGTNIQFIGIANSSSVDVNGSQITLEAWVKPSSIPSNTQWDAGIIGKDGYSSGYRLLYENPQDILFQLTGQSGYNTYSTTTANINTWYHIVSSYDGSTMQQYFNGVQDSSTQSRTGNVDDSSAYELLLGMGQLNASPSQYPFDGLIQEIRISKTARSADWIKTEYNNQNSPSTFYTVGAQMSR